MMRATSLAAATVLSLTVAVPFAGATEPGPTCVDDWVKPGWLQGLVLGSKYNAAEGWTFYGGVYDGSHTLGLFVYEDDVVIIEKGGGCRA